MRCYNEEALLCYLADFVACESDTVISNLLEAVCNLMLKGFLGCHCGGDVSEVTCLVCMYF